MSHINRVIHITLALLCVFTSTALTSCRSSLNLQTASSTLSAAASISTDDVSRKFVNRLTKNGTGLVRNVPAFSYHATQSSTLSDTLDIRWLNCPKYLNNGQLIKLSDAIPNITFNSDTIWPANIPSNFNHSAIMEAGKNPGLGVDLLHSKGITGKGVSIAIIDQTLFTGHKEYKDNLALYEEIHITPTESASMHGSTVASIAVGKTCGVAPNAKLYYWAMNFAKGPYKQDASDTNIAFADGVAVAIDRMLKVNDTLPSNEKIRVLSISRGFNDLKDAGVQTFLKAVKRAQNAGIFVITTSTFQYSEFMSRDTDFAGLGKTDLTGNPDNLPTYTLGHWEQSNAGKYINNLLAPMDTRTTADPSGENDYAFYAYGGFSWIAPYLAGLYALAVQVKPDITPKDFWATALKTSNKMTVTINNKQYTFNHVINPKKLIEIFK